MITGAQVKAARALLGLSQMDIALRAGVSQTSIWQLENSERTPVEARLRHIRRALEAAGVEFPEGEPPRLRRSPPPAAT